MDDFLKNEPISSVADPTDADSLIAPPPVPSKKFQEEAFQYVSKWCKAAHDFVQRKVERWKLLEDLYHNRRELNSWAGSSDLSAAQNRIALGKGRVSAKDRWQADIVVSPSYIVDNWTDRAYQAVFNGPEWLTVIPETHRGSTSEDLQFPTSYKLQELLLTRLEEGRIHVRMYEALQHLVLYGSVYAKVFWYSKGVKRYRWDFHALEVVENLERIYDCPIVQIIPLDRMLLDWTATHNDVQRHSGIGHRVDKTYEHVLDQFQRGVYNLNRDQFIARWRNASAHSVTEGTELGHDEDSEGLEADEIRKLTVWEWHGLIPTSKGQRECVCAFVTDRGSDSPEDGVMVRLTDAPVLWSGLRPFVSAHFTPMPGPLGMGAVESNLDLIHSISQFISQSQDNARLTANSQLIVRRGSSAARQISTEGDVVYPGKVWTVDDPGDIQPFPSLHFPQQDVNFLIDYLNGLLEKRTSVSEVSLGTAGGAGSATEAHILQEAGMAPLSTRTDLFARNFLEPLGKIALSMLQQFLLEDQTITVRNSDGFDMPLVVSAEEIQSGRYKVVATMTRQDSTRIAKAQSIERVLPTLARFQPVLAQEGVQISFSEMIKRYLDLLGVDGVDRVVTRINPNPSKQSGAGVPQEQASYQPESDPVSTDFPTRLVEDGGPVGPEPTDANALAQLLQLQAAGSIQK
jgi:hypothetical protein